MIVIVCQTFFQFLDMFGWQEGHPSHKTQTTYRQRFSSGMNGGGQPPGLTQWACYKKASTYGSRVGWTRARRIHTYIHTTQETHGKCGGECPTRKKLWNTRKLEKRSKIQLLNKACSETCDVCVCVVQVTTHVDRESAVTSVCRSRDIQASRVPVQIQTISCSTLWIAEDYSVFSVILLHRVSINTSQPMNLKCKQNWVEEIDLNYLLKETDWSFS